MTRRLQSFFGNAWDETFESLKSAPGAFGNIIAGSVRQIRPVDGLALALMAAGWVWLIGGVLMGNDHRTGFILLAILPSIAWFLAGLAGATMFVTGGIGPRALAYWESYVLILIFSGFGLVSLRLALNPRDRRIYRGTDTPIV